MRKNFILWWRTPACSIFEVLSPIVLMAVLWIIRLQVPSTPVTQEGMYSKKYVTFKGENNVNGTYDDHWSNLNQYVRPFFNYSDYHEKHDGPGESYDIGWDWYGPQFWSPTHCIQTFDFNRPKVGSPIIGIIGAQTEITDQLSQYMSVLADIQKSTAAKFAAPYYRTQHFESQQVFDEFISGPDYKNGRKNKGVCFGLQHYQSDNTAANNYTMSLHFPDKHIGVSKKQYAKGVPDQKDLVWSPYASSPDLDSYFRFQHNGFSFYNTYLANQILMNTSQNWNSFIGFVLQPLPTDTDIYDPFTQALAVLLPLFLLLAYIPPVYNMTFKIVREKESRAKETMRIMGMTDLPYWMSWFVFYTVINSLVSTLAWAMLLPACINYSQPFYIWIFFWLYGEAVFGQIIFLQSMFTGSKYAGIVSTIIYFSGVLINKIIMDDDVTRMQKLFASLLPQVAVMQGSMVFANYEGTGVGLTSSTVAVIYEDYSFNSALAMLLFDFFFFFLLGLYMDKIIPSDFGQRLNPCFLCTPSYYKCCRGSNRRPQVNQSDQDLLEQGADNDEFESREIPQGNYESPAVICKRMEVTGDYLKIEDLRKTFSGGFRAVQGVNVKMYNGQIFTLLGHNGAGKSTVISMLTGLLNKSQGNARCFNVDMFEQMDEVREFMGVCPQHDVLFDNLTPREHLDIFYDFKGGDPKRKQQEINSLIADVGLTIDQNKIAKTLSGGNKRKLSVSIALCGGSKLVLLDEPTSGMDLGARRNLWDMLKSYKKDKIIILTTHYMDEADVLGDRIGIMCKGKLQCIGSSLFLKNRFGVGYKLTFVKINQTVNPNLEPFLQSYFNGVQMINNLHEEISFVIPKTESQNFGAFFENLDGRLDEFEVRSYGVSMSNLEDVFLKINQEYAPDLFGDLKGFGSRKSLAQDGKQNEQYIKSIAASSEDKSRDYLAGITGSETSSPNQSIDEDQYDIDESIAGQNLIRGSSCIRSCTASSAKRLIIYKRDWCGLLCQIVIPITLVLFGLWLQSGPTKLTQSPPRPLSTGFYPYKQRVLMNSNPVSMAGDGFDVTGQELAAQLPNATTAFDVKFIDEPMNYTEFYNAVYEYRNTLPLFPYRYGSYQIYQANKASNIFNIINHLNVTSPDSTAMFPQFMYQAILRVATGDSDLEFNVINQPFPIYQKFIDVEEAAGAYDFVFMTAIALALIPCVMVQFILNERELQLKHQQLLSGMSLSGYWGSNLAFDIIMAYIPILLIILLMNVFSVNYEGAWVLFLLYPPAIVPYTYVTSFLFKSDINAQIMTLFLHFISGGLLVVIVFVLQYIPKTMFVGDPLRWLCCIFPSFCVTHGILFSASGTLLLGSRVEDTTDEGVIIPRKIPSEIWAFYNLKGDAIFLIGHFVAGILLLCLIELDLCQYFYWCAKPGCTTNSKKGMGPVLIKDDDVIREEHRVAMQDAERESFIQSHNGRSESFTGEVKSKNHVDCIRVHNFQKEYDMGCGAPVKAVRKASFGLDYGECFALLGVNGAGKSTTFKSLTKEITPTQGKIQIQGYDVQQDFADARKLIGYCPQYDAIFPMLSVEETLKFYALIKGIRTAKIMPVVEKAIKDLNLKDHRNKMAGTLSGGNKRKLSVAMALIGNPPIILLDEPSAGMDPEARRFMWQVVEKISQRDKKSAVILTTHSMEEAEALSTKMGIMVRGGVFRCMGSTQHIKNKFGVGYEIEIKVVKPTFHQMQEYAVQLGFQEDIQSRISLDQALQQLTAASFDELILEQVKEDGIGSDLVQEASLNDQREINLINLLEFLRAQTYGFSILHFLSRDFKYVEILEQCGEFFKLRVPKEDKTIGWLFGKLEQEKRTLGIQEYSVSQTTLEQIFQSFANQSIASDKAAYTFISRGDRLILQNPGHEMTDHEEQLSQRGLSFYSARENDDGGNASKPKDDQNDEDEGNQLLLPKENDV